MAMIRLSASFLNVAKSIGGSLSFLPLVVVDPFLALDDDAVESVLDFLEAGFSAAFLGGMVDGFLRVCEAEQLSRGHR